MIRSGSHVIRSGSHVIRSGSHVIKTSLPHDNMIRPFGRVCLTCDSHVISK